MSELDTKKNPTYAYGTSVWVKLIGRVWWPGIVVDPVTVPAELITYMRTVEYIAVVRFEDCKYEVVTSYKHIYFYTCERKDEFILRGLSSYKDQKKGMAVAGSFDMEKFKEEVIFIERLIGGDLNIFENLVSKQERVRSIVKQFFTPANKKKSKKKEVTKKSLPAPKLSQTPVSQPRTSTQSKVGQMYSASKLTNYSCHSLVGCKFTTTRYENLKRHMITHKNGENTDVVTTKKSTNSSTPSKRKNLKAKSLEVKKQKLQEELLKDWDDEDEIKTSQLQQSSSNVAQSLNEKVVKTSEVSSSSNVESSNEEVVQTMKEIIPTTNEILPTSKVLLTKSDVIPTIIDNKVQETITSSPNEVFDFNENDNNTSVVELRQTKSACSSTVDDISETFESQITPDFINSTIFDASPSESLLVEKTTEDSVDKPCEIHSSNKLANEIDDQSKSTELLLEKTVNTLDQINNFENSLSCISSSIKNSDANILTEDNNVIGVSELNECGSLNKIANICEDIHMETNGIDITLVENMSTETEDRAIVEENTNDKEIASNDVDVNQLNGTTIDKAISIENSCSVDSTSTKLDCEDKIAIKKDCLIDYMPKPKWAEGDDFEFAQEKLREADFVISEEIFYTPPAVEELTTLTTEKKSSFVTLKFSHLLELKSEVKETKQHDILDHKEACDLFVPLDYDGPRSLMEELTPDVNPNTEACQSSSMKNQFLFLQSLDNCTEPSSLSNDFPVVC